MPGIWPDLVPEIRQKRADEVLALPIDFTLRMEEGDNVATGIDEGGAKEWGLGDELEMESQINENIWIGKFTGGEAPSDHFYHVTVQSASGNRFGHAFVIQVRD